MALECGGLPPLSLLPCGAGLRDLCPVGIRFVHRPARQPVNHTEEKYHRDNQPWISRRDSHVPQQNNVARRYKQRRSQNNEKRSIQWLTCPSINLLRAGIAPGWYPSPTKSRL